MNQRRPNVGPRPQQAKNPQPGKNSQYWNRYRRPWSPYWHDWYDYDWYDYDWYDYDYDYDWYDYDGYSYSAPATEKMKKPMSARSNSVKPAEYTESQLTYQQGFKDGWNAAMNYMMNGTVPVEPVEPVQPMPTPTPYPPPMEGAPE